MYFVEPDDDRTTAGAAGPGYDGALPPPPLPPPGFSAMPFDYGSSEREAGEYAAVGFSYGEQQPEAAEEEAEEEQPAGGGHMQQAQQAQQEEEPFVPPFLVPERLRAHLPLSQRQYKVGQCLTGQQGCASSTAWLSFWPTVHQQPWRTALPLATAQGLPLCLRDEAAVPPGCSCRSCARQPALCGLIAILHSSLFACQTCCRSCDRRLALCGAVASSWRCCCV